MSVHARNLLPIHDECCAFTNLPQTFLKNLVLAWGRNSKRPSTEMDPNILYLLSGLIFQLQCDASKKNVEPKANARQRQRSDKEPRYSHSMAPNY